ncbi:MAG TPA: o-succinylbenzoate synthase [Leptolyngbyaceae cyanobacterium M65_K2018_010]|nr:o-succinylbenzoate synthase [Leptolyngbyaceae cyanobacterium M65_K2018_010]
MGLELAIKGYSRQFRQPLKTAHGPWQKRQGLLVRLEDGLGRVGYGEIAPLPWFGSETLAAAQAFCKSLAKVPLWPAPLPFGLACDPAGPEANPDLLREGRRFSSLTLPNSLPATQFGLATAMAQLQGQGVAAVPSPEPHASFICGLLPAGAAALKGWPALWQSGTRTFKWKIGVDGIATERALLTTLVQALPPTSRLRLDANGGLTVSEAAQWLDLCDRLNSQPDTCAIEFLEQPLPPDQVAVMAHLGQRFRTAIALDESVATLPSLERCHQQGWSGIFVVKPALAGCPHRLRQFWQRHSPQLVFSSAFETVVGRQAALALAADYAAQLPPSAPPLALGFGTLDWFEDNWDSLTPTQLWDSL